MFFIKFELPLYDSINSFIIWIVKIRVLSLLARSGVSVRWWKPIILVLFLDDLNIEILKRAQYML